MSTPNSTDEPPSMRDEYMFEPPDIHRAFLRPWERKPQRAVAPQLRGRKIWKRYNLRGKQHTSSSEKTNAGSQCHDKKALHTSKRRRLCDPLAGLGKQSPSQRMPYAPSFRETQESVLQRKAELHIPAETPAKSPSKRLIILKSPSCRESLGASILKDRGRTKSSIDNRPFQSMYALGNNHAVDGETPMLLDMETMGIKSLASDDSQSPFSRRRSARLSARYEYLATRTETQSAITSDALLAQAIHEELKEIDRVIYDCTKQNEKSDLNVSASIDIGESDTIQEPVSPRATSPNTVYSTWKIWEELLPAVSGSKLVTESEEDEDMEQDQFALVPYVPSSLESLSPDSLDDILQDDLTGAKRNVLDITATHKCVALSTASPKLPSSDCRDTPKTATDASNYKKPDFTSDGLLPDGQTGEVMQLEYYGHHDELLDAEAFSSGGSSPGHQDVDEQLAVILDSEASPDQVIDMAQQVSRSESNEILDVGDGIKEDDQLAAVHDRNTEKDSESVDNLHDNEDLLRKSITIAAGRIRSRTRVSDETMLLKDFLSRTQARRAASQSTEPSTPAAKSPPRKRSTRKPLHPLNANSPSSTKSGGLVAESESPARTTDENVPAEEALDKPIADLASQRRSTRTRPVVSTKTPLSVPSFIPLRRADRADSVILQKSANQELSIATRANTRRNKGRARLPKMMLVELAKLAKLAEREDSQIVKQDDDGVFHGQRAAIKFVRWDESQLVQYQEAPVDTDEGNDTRPIPKMRRLRGLGATNGTPAPKRVSRALLTPASLNRVTKPKAVSK